MSYFWPQAMIVIIIIFFLFVGVHAVVVKHWRTRLRNLRQQRYMSGLAPCHKLCLKRNVSFSEEEGICHITSML